MKIILLIVALVLEIFGAFLLSRGTMLGYKNHVAKELKSMVINSIQTMKEQSRARNALLPSVYTQEMIDELNNKSDSFYDSLIANDQQAIQRLDSEYNHKNLTSGAIGLSCMVIAFILQCVVIYLTI